MRVLVAGATGVVGRSLLPALRAAGDEVVALVRAPDRRAAVDAETVVADALDREATIAAVREAQPEAIIDELTALPRAVSPRRVGVALQPTNALRRRGTDNLVAGAEAAGARRLVVQSVAFAYAPVGDAVKDEDAPLWHDAPNGFDAAVAAVTTLESATRRFGGTVLRYGSLYGPGTTFDPDGGSTAAAVRRRAFPIVGDGGGVFSFVHVDDAASATVAALHCDARGRFNVVDDDPSPVRDWLPAYARAIGAPLPSRVPRFLARLRVGAYGTADMTERRGARNARARRELSWRPEATRWDADEA
jgi:nucleoside-diphosphate-sugar epimerase